MRQAIMKAAPISICLQNALIKFSLFFASLIKSTRLALPYENARPSQVVFDFAMEIATKMIFGLSFWASGAIKTTKKIVD